MVEKASPEETVVCHALNVARSCNWLRFKVDCDYSGGCVRGTALQEVLYEARRLWHPLNYLRESLADAATRQRWSDANPNGVEYAGEVGTSYVEAVFRAGERLYSTINCLCRHGVLFPYLSRMHPASTQLGELFPEIPKVEDIEFTGWIAPDGHGNQCDSSSSLLTAICREVKALQSIDPDQAIVYLEKEIARVIRGNNTHSSPLIHSGPGPQQEQEQAVTVKSVWLISLTGLRSRFEAGANEYHGIWCSLVRESYANGGCPVMAAMQDIGKGAHNVIRHAVEGFCGFNSGQIFRGSEVIFTFWFIHDALANAVRYNHDEIYSADKKAEECEASFLELAEEAGRLLEDLPSQLCPYLTELLDTPKLQFGSLLWIVAVFEVAKHKPAGTVLRTSVTIPQLDSVRVRVTEAVARGEIVDGAVINLNCNPFSASVAVIDYLLSSSQQPAGGVTSNASPASLLRAAPHQQLLRLKPSQQKAYSQYQAAIHQEPRLANATDKEVYKYVEANLLDDGEALPKVETWISYVQKARSAEGKQKNQPRSGRTGRSIVRSSQL